MADPITIATVAGLSQHLGVAAFQNASDIVSAFSRIGRERIKLAGLASTTMSYMVREFLEVQPDLIRSSTELSTGLMEVLRKTSGEEKEFLLTAIRDLAESDLPHEFTSALLTRMEDHHHTRSMSILGIVLVVAISAPIIACSVSLVIALSPCVVFVLGALLLAVVHDISRPRSVSEQLFG